MNPRRGQSILSFVALNLEGATMARGRARHPQHQDCFTPTWDRRGYNNTNVFVCRENHGFECCYMQPQESIRSYTDFVNPLFAAAVEIAKLTDTGGIPCVWRQRAPLPILFRKKRA